MAKSSEKPLATIEDLQASYKALSPDEAARAETVLLQASNYLRLVARNNHVDLDYKISCDSTGVYGANVKAVILAATQRLMASPVEMMPDATQWSQSASPYSESMSFPAGTSGGIYFKERELKLLGFRNTSGSRQFGVLKGARG